MKITHLAAGIAVAAGLVLGAAKGYVHYQVKSAVDDALDMARMFVDIQYKDLDTDLSGSATLHGISIFPNDFPESFNIDALTLRGPDLDFLLNGFETSAQRGELPAQLEIDIHGLHLRTDGYLLSSMEKSMQEIGRLLNFEADGCGLGTLFGYEDYKALGLSEIPMNMRMGYRFSDSFPGIELQFDYTAGRQSAQMVMNLAGISRSLSAVRGSPPKLSDMKMHFRADQEMTRKVIKYCADKRGIDADTYIAQLIESPDAQYMLHLGFVPGPGLRDALQQMLTKAGEMTVEMKPYEPLDITQLALYSAEQMPDLLMLSVSVNGKSVEDLSMTSLDLSTLIDPVALSKLEDGDIWLEHFGIERPQTAEPSESTRTARTTQSETGEYKNVNRNELNRHIGRQVRILASGGRKRSGVLVKLRNGVATLEEHVYGGKLTSSVALGDIKKVEVQF